MSDACRRLYCAGFGCILITWTAAAAQETPPPPPAAPQAPRQAAGGPDDVAEVEADGEGTSKEQALRAALRAALEKGGRTEVFSDTQVQNFQVIHDTIIARAEGIVTDYKVLRESEGVGGTFRVRIRARVSKKVLAESWGAIQNVLNQIGRPKIMVLISEAIDGRPEEQSILETEIEKRLLGSGFDLVEKTAMAAIREKENADAAVEKDTKKLQAIAKDFEAHIFIVGTANAHQAGLESVYNTPIAFYNCDVQLKAYYTDTGKLLASAGIPNTRGGARGRKEFSPQAGKMALSIAGKNAVEEIYQQVMRQWATQIGAGGELILEVAGIRFKAANDLKKAIAELEGVNNVNFKLSKEIATYHVNARMTAPDLAERLSEGVFEQMIEISDLRQNRIQGRAVGAK